MAARKVDLDSAIGYRLKEVDSVLRATMDAALWPLGLTVPQYAALEVLARHPEASVAELTRRSFVTRQSLHVLMRGLVARGWVLIAEPVVGRSRAVHLTDSGRAALGPASAAIAEIEDRMTAPLAGADRERLLELLDRCRDALSGRG